MTQHAWFHQFLRVTRASLACGPKAVRVVHRSEIIRSGANVTLEKVAADVLPLFYRDFASIAASLEAGFFTSTMQTTLARLPTAPSFQESHMAEALACIFAESVLGLRRIYSKLALLTSENANAYKMDIVLYNPKTDPIELVLTEVKSSTKTALDGLPAGHDKSCFADVFASMNKYKPRDLSFDLVAAADRLSLVPEPDRQRVREALLPYSASPRRYAAIVVIDRGTFHPSEGTVLGTRRNAKTFDVDLLCVEDFGGVVTTVYDKLGRLRDACSP